MSVLCLSHLLLFAEGSFYNDRFLNLTVFLYPQCSVLREGVRNVLIAHEFTDTLGAMFLMYSANSKFD